MLFANPPTFASNCKHKSKMYAVLQKKTPISQPIPTPTTQKQRFTGKQDLRCYPKCRSRQLCMPWLEIRKFYEYNQAQSETYRRSEPVNRTEHRRSDT